MVIGFATHWRCFGNVRETCCVPEKADFEAKATRATGDSGARRPVTAANRSTAPITLQEIAPTTGMFQLNISSFLEYAFECPKNRPNEHFQQLEGAQELHEIQESFISRVDLPILRILLQKSRIRNVYRSPMWTHIECDKTPHLHSTFQWNSIFVVIWSFVV